MLNFVFDNKTRIIFGKGTENEVGAYTKQFGKKVLLHYGGGSIKRFGLYDTVVQSLHENGVEFVELGGVLPNPRLSLVHEGIELCRKEKVDFILACIITNYFYCSIIKHLMNHMPPVYQETMAIFNLEVP